MPTPGQISKENLKQILVFVPAVVYNIFVVLFSCQVNYITQRRICPACGLQILLCRVGPFFTPPLFSGIKIPAEHSRCKSALAGLHRELVEKPFSTGCEWELRLPLFCTCHPISASCFHPQDMLKSFYPSCRPSTAQMKGAFP